METSEIISNKPKGLEGNLDPHFNASSPLDPQNKLPAWSTFYLKKISSPNPKAVLMGDYLVVLFEQWMG